MHLGKPFRKIIMLDNKPKLTIPDINIRSDTKGYLKNF